MLPGPASLCVWECSQAGMQHPWGARGKDEKDISSLNPNKGSVAPQRAEKTLCPPHMDTERGEGHEKAL